MDIITKIITEESKRFINQFPNKEKKDVYNLEKLILSFYWLYNKSRLHEKEKKEILNSVCNKVKKYPLENTFWMNK